jgi:hypothetical protein
LSASGKTELNDERRRTLGIHLSSVKAQAGALIAISIFWFALNYHGAALLLLLIPDQVTGLLPARGSAQPSLRSPQVQANWPPTLAPGAGAG